MLIFQGVLLMVQKSGKTVELGSLAYDLMICRVLAPSQVVAWDF